MKFGLFGSAKSAPIDSDIDSAAGYNDWIKFNQEAEKLGYYSTFTVEHHFTGLGQVSASMSLLTFLAAKTSTIRLGTAVMALPWHNPILLAEQASTLDLIGTKEEIIDRLHELREGGINYILLVDNGGGIKGLDRFANEIIPSIH